MYCKNILTSSVRFSSKSPARWVSQITLSRITLWALLQSLISWEMSRLDPSVNLLKSCSQSQSKNKSWFFFFFLLLLCTFLLPSFSVCLSALRLVTLFPQLNAMWEIKGKLGASVSNVVRRATMNCQKSFMVQILHVSGTVPEGCTSFFQRMFPHLVTFYFFFYDGV